MIDINGGLIGRIRELQDKIGTIAQPYVMVFIRVIFGYMIFRAGWGKLQNLEQVKMYFTFLEIPMPGVNAVIVAFCEAAGGLLIMLGLFTRVASVVLIGVMSVAVLTAHMSDLSPFFSLPDSIWAAPSKDTTYALPTLYIVMFLITAAFGAGKLSLDNLLVSKLGGQQTSE